MPVCEICGKEFRTPQGLRGHKTFVHGLGRQTEAVEIFRRAIERRREEKARKEDLAPIRELEEMKRELQQREEEIKRLKAEAEKRQEEIERLKTEAERRQEAPTQPIRLPSLPSPPSLADLIPSTDPITDLDRALKKLDKLLTGTQL